jgi:hypothetical protein
LPGSVVAGGRVIIAWNFRVVIGRGGVVIVNDIIVNDILIILTGLTTVVQ